MTPQQIADIERYGPLVDPFPKWIAASKSLGLDVARMTIEDVYNIHDSMILDHDFARQGRDFSTLTADQLTALRARVLQHAKTFYSVQSAPLKA